MGYTQQPFFSFGVITDIQYADIDVRLSFRGVPRYYRHSFEVLKRAVTTWNDHSKLHFALNLGDMVDGFCPKDQSMDTVNKIIQEFDKFHGPVYHTIGNHCLYNLPRSKLNSVLNIPSINGCAYYDFSPVAGFRLVFLDPYDISAIGWPKDHPTTLEAMKLLQSKNPNENKNSPEGLVGLEQRFVMFNGAIGKKQLQWLEDTLIDSTEHEQKVIICSHVPLDPAASPPEALVWNYREVLDVVHRYSCVKACFSGHEHGGGYSVDSHGVHHRIFEAALECPPGTNSFGHVEVYHDRLIVLGTGRMRSTEMVFTA